MRIAKLFLIAVAVFLAYKYYQDNLAFNHPLAGKWKSHKEKTLAQYYQAGIDEAQEKKLKSTLGRKIISINRVSWASDLDGKLHIASYGIESERDGCYVIAYSVGPKAEACIKADEMTLTTLPKSRGQAAEIYVRPK